MEALPVPHPILDHGEGASPPGASQGAGERRWGRNNLERGQEASHGSEEADAGRDLGAGSRKDAQHHPRNQRRPPGATGPRACHGGQGPHPCFFLKDPHRGTGAEDLFPPRSHLLRFPLPLPPRHRKAALVSEQPGLDRPGASCRPAPPHHFGKTHPPGKAQLGRASRTILPLQSSEGTVWPR